MYAVKQSQTIGYSIPKYFIGNIYNFIFDTNIENAKKYKKEIAENYCDFLNHLSDNYIYYSVVRIEKDVKGNWIEIYL